MSKALVIVESPAKVKTINKILGAKYKVTSSMGHLIDLPKSTLGVDLEKDFEPKLIVVRAKQKVLGKLKKEAKGKTEIRADPRWLKAQSAFFDLSEKFRADPLVT